MMTDLHVQNCTSKAIITTFKKNPTFHQMQDDQLYVLHTNHYYGGVDHYNAEYFKSSPA